MQRRTLIPVSANSKSQQDIVVRGFSRQPLLIDVDVASALAALAHAAWTVPRDQYYEAGPVPISQSI